MGSVIVGVDVGQKHDPTAIAVVEVERRTLEAARWAMPQGLRVVDPSAIVRVPARVELAYTGRHIERLALGTPYPQVATHVAGVVKALVARGIARPSLVVDATGVGQPVVELIAEALGHRRRDLMAATFTHGDRYTQDNARRIASVGKAYLVSRLQALFQTDRIRLPATPDALAMKEELIEYEIRVDADANDKYGAFKVGKHDDLVTALGLAVCYQEPPPTQMWVGDGDDRPLERVF